MSIKNNKNFFTEKDLNILKNILNKNNKNNKNVLKIKNILLPFKYRELYYKDSIDLFIVLNENDCIYSEFIDFKKYANSEDFNITHITKINDFIERYEWYDLELKNIELQLSSNNLKDIDFKNIKKIIDKPIESYKTFSKLAKILKKYLSSNSEIKKTEFLQEELFEEDQVVNYDFIKLNYFDNNTYFLYGNIWFKRFNKNEVSFFYEFSPEIDEINLELDNIEFDDLLCLNLKKLKNFYKNYKNAEWYNYKASLNKFIEKIDDDNFKDLNKNLDVDLDKYLNFNDSEFLFLHQKSEYYNEFTSSEDSTDYSDDNLDNYEEILNLKNNFFFKINLKFKYPESIFIIKNINFFFNKYNLNYFSIKESDYDNNEDNYIHCMGKYVSKYTDYFVYNKADFDSLNPISMHIEYKFTYGDEKFLYHTLRNVYDNDNLSDRIKNNAVFWIQDWAQNLYFYTDTKEFSKIFINKFNFYQVKLNEKILYLNNLKYSFNEEYYNDLLNYNNDLLNCNDDLDSFIFNKLKIRKNLFCLQSYKIIFIILNEYYVKNIITIYLHKNFKIIFFKNKLFKKNIYIFNFQLFWRLHILIFFIAILKLKK